MAAESGPEPPLEATIHIQASPDAVWSLVSDIKRMGEWSPQYRGGRWIGARGPAVGARFLGVNRQGRKWWVTTSRVVESDPGRVFAFRTEQNRATWVFRLEPDGNGGTNVVQRRELPTGRTALSTLAAKLFLGGNEKFDAILRADMQQTLTRIKAAAESA